MDFSIDGTVAQSARLTLALGESVWASKGSIIAYAAGLKWDLRVPGGLAGAFKRSLSGEGISLTSTTRRTTTGNGFQRHRAQGD